MVAGARECEIKLAVPDEASLERLEARFGGAPVATVHQDNVYFDAGRRLTDARWGLRLRREDDRSVLTLKGPKERSDGALVSRPETPDVLVDDDVAARILAGDEDPLDHLASGLAGRPELAYVETVRAILDGARVAPWGEMANERRKYPLAVGGRTLLVEVDRTDYGRFGRRFEVELEIPDPALEAEARSWLEGHFSALGLPLEPSPAKMARLFAFLDGSPTPA